MLSGVIEIYCVKELWDFKTSSMHYVQQKRYAHKCTEDQSR